jgi:hypothetical protein
VVAIATERQLKHFRSVTVESEDNKAGSAAELVKKIGFL